MSKPKGKKYTAAEKHFIEKEVQYKRRIALLEAEHSEYVKRIRELEKQCNEYQSKLEQIQEWNERLLEYADLSESDIKQACEKDKATANMMKTFTGLMRFSGMY